MRAYRSILQEPDVLQPHVPGPSVLPNVRQSEFEASRNDAPRFLGLVNLRRINRIHSPNVVEIEFPQGYGRGRSEAAGKEGFDSVEERVREFQIDVRDPLFRLE